jgi:hypothetical protein
MLLGKCADHDLVTIRIPERKLSRSRGGVHLGLQLKSTNNAASPRQRFIEVVAAVYSKTRGIPRCAASASTPHDAK